MKLGDVKAETAIMAAALEKDKALVKQMQDKLAAGKVSAFSTSLV